MNVSARRGLTRTELLIGLVFGVVVLALLLVFWGNSRKVTPAIQEGTQLRSIVQGFQLFASSNRSRFPLPTRVDLFGGTEGERFHFTATMIDRDHHKNRTGAILAVAIQNYLISPETCVSPNDVGNVRVFDEYEFVSPSGANDPAHATYDPAFNGTPFDSANDAFIDNNVVARDTESHNSFAHNCVAFGRAINWSNQTPSSTPLWSTRGPVYQDDTRDTYDPARPGWEVLKNDPLGDGSNALRMWEPANAWAGNVARADGSVEFLTSPESADTSLIVSTHDGSETTVADNVFVDEHFEHPEDWKRRNAYLRQWKRGIPMDFPDPDTPPRFSYTTHLAPSNDANGFAWTD